jgi:hypothetical protein
MFSILTYAVVLWKKNLGALKNNLTLFSQCFGGNAKCLR